MVPRHVTLAGRQYVEHDLDCPDCGALMILVPFGAKVIYRCVRHKTIRCRGTHGAHPDGSPLGTPAPWPVREARKKAHAVFDLLWNGPDARMSRGAAYQWLQDSMHMTRNDAHISRFDAAQCEQVLRLVREQFGLEPEPDPGEGQGGFFNVEL